MPPDGQPVAQLVIVRRHREDHAHLERFALALHLFDHRLQCARLDRMNGLAVGAGRNVLLHLGPDLVRHRDAVAVEIHREGRDDVGLGAEADGRGDRLAGQHVRAIELAGDDAVEQHFPVGLRLEGDEEAFVFEEALLLGDGDRHHVGELDEAELQLVLLGLEWRGVRAAGDHALCGNGAGGGKDAAASEGEAGLAGHRLSPIRT